MSRAVVPSSIVFEVLDQHNYVDWSEALEAYLKARDLWDVVKFYQQPPKTIEKTKFKAWEKKNAAALHAIKISCGANMLHIIRGITEANEAWLCLKACFKVPPSVSESQIFSGIQVLKLKAYGNEYGRLWNVVRNWDKIVIWNQGH